MNHHRCHHHGRKEEGGCGTMEEGMEIYRGWCVYPTALSFRFVSGSVTIDLVIVSVVTPIEYHHHRTNYKKTTSTTSNKGHPTYTTHDGQRNTRSDEGTLWSS